MFIDTLYPDNLIDEHYKAIETSSFYKVENFIAEIDFESEPERNLVFYALNKKKTKEIKNEKAKLKKARKRGKYSGES